MASTRMNNTPGEYRWQQNGIYISEILCCLKIMLYQHSRYFQD